jgi:hypothetical protein
LDDYSIDVNGSMTIVNMTGVSNRTYTYVLNATMLGQSQVLNLGVMSVWNETMTISNVTVVAVVSSTAEVQNATSYPLSVLQGNNISIAYNNNNSSPCPQTLLLTYQDTVPEQSNNNSLNVVGDVPGFHNVSVSVTNGLGTFVYTGQVVFCTLSWLFLRSKALLQVYVIGDLSNFTVTVISNPSEGENYSIAVTNASTPCGLELPALQTLQLLLTVGSGTESLLKFLCNHRHI